MHRSGHNKGGYRVLEKSAATSTRESSLAKQSPCALHREWLTTHHVNFARIPEPKPTVPDDVTSSLFQPLKHISSSDNPPEPPALTPRAPCHESGIRSWAGRQPRGSVWARFPSMRMRIKPIWSASSHWRALVRAHSATFSAAATSRSYQRSRAVMMRIRWMERVMFILYTTYIVKSEAIAPEERKNYVQCSHPLSSKSQNIPILHITYRLLEWRTFIQTGMTKTSFRFHVYYYYYFHSAYFLSSWSGCTKSSQFLSSELNQNLCRRHVDAW